MRKRSHHQEDSGAQVSPVLAQDQILTCAGVRTVAVAVAGVLVVTGMEAAGG